MKRILMFLSLITIMAISSTAYAKDRVRNYVPLLPDKNSDNINIANNPQCVGSTDRPHNSTHVPGTVNVVGKTSCPVVVDSLKITTSLYQEKCLWGICVWSKVKSGTATKSNTSRIQTNAAVDCSPTRYYGKSSHEAVYQGSLFLGISQSDVVTISSC